ncbi:MAG: phosphatase PAP2 family protein [bacterium]
MEFYSNIDAELFYLINRDFANPFFDWLMPIITNQHYWMGLSVVVWLALIAKGGRVGRTVAILIIPTLVLAQLSSSTWFKPLFARLRPCQALTDVRLLIDCIDNYAFPSGHAADSFAAAWLLAYFYKRLTLVFFTLATVVSFSRIYIGVHYPADVLAGSFLGICCAGLSIVLFNVGNSFYLEKVKQKLTQEGKQD